VLARITERAKASLTPSERGTTRLYRYPWILAKGEQIGPAFRRCTLDRPSILVFADEEPDAGFAHPCSYLLYDAGTGAPIHQVIAGFPPYPLTGLQGFEPIWTPPRIRAPRGDGVPRAAGPKVLADEIRLAGEALAAAPGGRRIAILFAGAADAAHLNDLELSYRILTEDFDFRPENVHVLFHNGKNDSYLFDNPGGGRRDWPGSAQHPDFKLDVKMEGTRANFQNVLAGLHLKANDSLFIHTEGHGGNDGYELNNDCFLAEYSDASAQSKYRAEDMKADLQALDHFHSLLVLMNQCFCGGFAQYVIDGSKADLTYVAYAAAANKRAFTQSDDWYDFSFDWLQAQKGAQVGDQNPPLPLPGTPPAENPNGSVKASGAFMYASSHVDNRASPDFAHKPDTAGSPADDISLQG
jgi:hypothetical protein